MPTYDYACARCGRTIEVMHGVHAHGPATCEHCGGEMRKLLSPPAIVFKGTGWAKKDRGSRPGTTKAKTGPDTKADSGAAAKPAASTDGQSAPSSTGGSGPDA